MVPVKYNRLTYRAVHRLQFTNVGDHSDDTEKKGNLESNGLKSCTRPSYPRLGGEGVSFMRGSSQVIASP